MEIYATCLKTGYFGTSPAGPPEPELPSGSNSICPIAVSTLAITLRYIGTSSPILRSSVRFPESEQAVARRVRASPCKQLAETVAGRLLVTTGYAKSHAILSRLDEFGNVCCSIP